MLGDAADGAEAPPTLQASGGAPPPLAGAKKSLGDPVGPAKSQMDHGTRPASASLNTLIDWTPASAAGSRNALARIRKESIKKKYRSLVPPFFFLLLSRLQRTDTDTMRQSSTFY
jgi:hypothetical protein